MDPGNRIRVHFRLFRRYRPVVGSSTQQWSQVGDVPIEFQKSFADATTLGCQITMGGQVG